MCFGERGCFHDFEEDDAIDNQLFSLSSCRKIDEVTISSDFLMSFANQA